MFGPSRTGSPQITLPSNQAMQRNRWSVHMTYTIFTFANTDLNLSDDCGCSSSESILGWALVWLTYPAKLQKESDSGLICGAGL
jgi:hypothetical protein